jgi:alpha-tubulin suppressor-like RCC1 family protein
MEFNKWWYSIHSLATKTDGTLWSWGYNGAGQLGQNDRISCSSPVQIPGTSWSSISGGNNSFISNSTSIINTQNQHSSLCNNYITVWDCPELAHQC